MNAKKSRRANVQTATAGTHGEVMNAAAMVTCSTFMNMILVSVSIINNLKAFFNSLHIVFF